MKIDVNKVARKIEVDNSISLGYYYRIADNLLRQANIHREEKNIVDLYIILLRFSSLVLDTIPYHRDYQVLFPRERDTFKKRFRSVLNELEALKPEFERLVDELNKDYARTQSSSLDSGPSSSQSSAVNNLTYSSVNVKRPFGVSAQPSWKYDYNRSQVSSSNSPQLDKQLQKLSIGISLPKQETLSRHSFLGPNGLRSQWQGPTAQIKVQYPSYTELSSDENLIVKQAGNGSLAVKDSVSDTGVVGSTMESVLSLDDGRWSHPEQALTTALINEASADPFQFVGVRQPLPPPVLAHVQNKYSPIPPSQVADPRPGPAKPQDGIPTSNSYQHLHVPVSLMEDFLRLARSNTKKNLETCGVLAGSLKNKVFYITTLIIPKQEATSDSEGKPIVGIAIMLTLIPQHSISECMCSTLNEEEIFEVQDKMGLFPLGWIHTHPSQTCFMSSVDLHTHYSYQIMLPEAVAIVMAPTDTSSPHGIFHLSDPGGLSVIRNCDQRGFHPHEEALDGSSIYEHCSHVFMNSKCKFDVVDLR